MDNAKDQKNVPLSTYRYLMTVARRKGIEDIRIRLIIANNGKVALVRGHDTGGIRLLPRCEIGVEVDGEDIGYIIRNAVEKTGLDFSCVRKYLGSRDSRCFYFEVRVKNRERRRDILWAGKCDISRLNLSEEEKRILKGYFDRG